MNSSDIAKAGDSANGKLYHSIVQVVRFEVVKEVLVDDLIRCGKPVKIVNFRTNVVASERELTSFRGETERP